MKKNVAKKLMFFALASCVLWSCKKTPVPPAVVEPEDETITLTLSGGADIKTSLQEDKKVLWEEGDKVLVNQKEFTIVYDPSNPAIAKVERVPKSNSYLALYGNNSVVENNSVIYQSIPAVQQYKEGGFATGINPMAAYVENATDLMFKNVGAIIKINLKGDGETLSSVKVVSNSKVPVSGVVTYSLEDVKKGLNSSAIKVDNQKYGAQSQSYVELNGLSNITLNQQAKSFYFVTAPFTDASGLSVYVKDSNGNLFVQEGTNAFSIERGQIKEFPALNFEHVTNLEASINSTTSNTISLKLKGRKGYNARYGAIAKSAWVELVDGGMKTESEMASFVLSLVPDQVCDLTSAGVDKELSTFATLRSTVTGLKANTEYKVVAQYYDGDAPVGDPVWMDATTAIATGSAPTVDLSNPTIEYDKILLPITTNAVSAFSSFFLESDYNKLISSPNKTEQQMVAEYLNKYGYIDNSVAEPSHVFTYEYLPSRTNYVFVYSAVAQDGAETIYIWKGKTANYLFDPENIQFEIVTEKARVSTNLFSADFGVDLTIENVSILKVPNQEVYVIKNLFKNNDQLKQKGFQDATEEILTILDARDHNRIDIRVVENALGVYKSTGNITSQTHWGTPEEPRGVYSVEGTLHKLFFAEVFMKCGDYQSANASLTISWDNVEGFSGVGIEDFEHSYIEF